MPNFLNNFLNMGGYGYFIWSAFGLSAIILISLLIQSLKFLKSSESQLQLLQEEDNKNET